MDEETTLNEAQVRAIVQDELQKLATNTRTQPDRTIHQKDIQILDGRNIQIGRTNGTMIGTVNDQKLGFFGTTPVVQQAAVTAPSGGGSGSSNAVDVSARTAINQIATDLKNLGLTK